MCRRIFFKVLVLVLVIPLVSCGGGGIEFNYEGPTFIGPDPSSSTSQLPTDVVSIGPIARLASFAVNGVTYDTRTAGITVNGETGVLSDLNTGYVVIVKGSLETAWTSGTADQISFDANVIGPVESVDPVRRQLLVMGQRVRIDANTRFAPPFDLDALFSVSTGTPLQVSGLSDANGDIIATHVRTVTNRQDYQVIGAVSGIDYGKLTFRINDLTVDYSSALVINLPSGAPSNAMALIARGTLGTDGIFYVSELVNRVDTADFVDDSHIALTGYITRYKSDTDFSVDGLPVTTEFRTIFLNGLRRDLTLGAEVEIDGRWSGSGKVIAETIWFK